MQKRPRSEGGDGMLAPPGGEGLAQGGVPSAAPGGMDDAAAAAYLGAVPPDQQQQHAVAAYGYPQEAEAYAAAAAQAVAAQQAAAAAGQGQMPGGVQVLCRPSLVLESCGEGPMQNSVCSSLFPLSEHFKTA